MAKANRALAAVNGDFGMWWPLRPVHSFSDDGSLVATGSLDSAFAVSEDKSHSYISRVTPSVNGTYGASPSSVLRPVQSGSSCGTARQVAARLGSGSV